MSLPHGRSFVLALGASLSGCVFDQAAYIERQREICHEVVGCSDRPWWPDADGDGWGDPDGVIVMAPQPVPGLANNLLDCDDADPQITADLNGLCPHEFGEDVEVLGRVDTEEFIAVLGHPGWAFHEAFDRCLAWGGALGLGEPVALTPLWVAAAPDDLPETSAGAFQPGDGPFLFDGSFEVGDPLTPAGVGCVRPLPDPADWTTTEVPR